MPEQISLKETASMLGVSTATVRNWIRHNYLTPLQGTGTKFNLSQVKDLKCKIENGELKRLSTRANKRNALRKFIPYEQFSNNQADTLYLITNYVNENSLRTDLSIFLLSLNLLFKKKFLATNDLEAILHFESKNFTNTHIMNELREWHEEFGKEKITEIYLQLLYFEIPEEEDVLGIIYQSILLEGAKARHGSYYTPKNIIRDISNEYIRSDSKILDPCCGTGLFLLVAGERLENPENLYGIDTDYIAVKIAKINLIIKFNQTLFKPNIFVSNTLVDGDTIFSALPSECFDLVCSNPPWGAHYSPAEVTVLRKLYQEISSGEAFSYFILRGLQFLKKDGVLSYILPESILNVHTHYDIRNYILKNTSIIRINSLGKIFDNVFTPAIRLDLKNFSTAKNHVEINNLASSFRAAQQRFENNEGKEFDIFLTDYDEEIINKIYQYPYTTLKGKAEWALGIVTGDNSKFLVTKLSKGYEPIFTGQEVEKYFLSEPKKFIIFSPELFQQTAPPDKYRNSEKLIYRFISRKLIFAYDSRQRLTLNSANILIPHLDNYPVIVVAAFLNSSVFQFIYEKKFHSLKVLRSHLEVLPFPKLSITQINRIAGKADGIISGSGSIAGLDEHIFELYSLTADEKSYIRDSIK